MSVAPPPEQILVVPTAVFRRVGYFEGFNPRVEDYIEPLLHCPQVEYRPRPAMEQDPAFKQLIPYVIFEYDGEQGAPLVFQYTRGTGQGESRLHALKSIGVGGHISSVDGHSKAVYDIGMQRELEEEVEIDTPYQASCVGLLNDDSNDVGKVHLGIVHRFLVERPAVRPREPDLVDAGFRPASELLKELDRFETWSQICLRALYM